MSAEGGGGLRTCVAYVGYPWTGHRCTRPGRVIVATTSGERLPMCRQHAGRALHRGAWLSPEARPSEPWLPRTEVQAIERSSEEASA